MEKLTKEKCVFALAGLYSAANGEHDEENKDTLQRLIDEHFDNPSLKFEELKRNMWIWDNKDKEWCKYIDDHVFEYIDGYSGTFEENRFYLREVKIDEVEVYVFIR